MREVYAGLDVSDKQTHICLGKLGSGLVSCPRPPDNRVMSRPLRIEFPSALYHVTSRGDARADIVEDDAERLIFVDALGAAVERFGWLRHAWCLMDNHHHAPDRRGSRPALLDRQQDHQGMGSTSQFNMQDLTPNLEPAMPAPRISTEIGTSPL